MSNTPLISSLAALIALIGAQPALAQAYEPVLDEGQEIENQIDGDLNGDARPDSAFVVYNSETFARELRVALSYATEVDIGFEPEEVLPLEPTLLGPAELAIERGVLKVTDLVGGTTAINAVYRFRYDRAGEPGQFMRLIGLDATLYSRTYAHDGFELNWNLLNGDLITRELHLNTKGGDAAYDPIVERKTKRTTPRVWLAQSPDPQELIDELSQR